MFDKFVKAGHPVFKIKPMVDCVCECGCKKGGKHPVSNTWQNTPVWSEEKLADVISRGMPNYGVLIKTLLVIDVDIGEDKKGDESLAKLIDAVPEIAECAFIVKTGGGGYHYYFSLLEERALWTNHKEYPDIDFKSSGYVIGPGSAHASGNTYTVLSGDISEVKPAPSRLLDLLTKPDYVRVEGQTDVSKKELIEMLACIDADCEEPTWRLIGAAIHHLTNGSQEGFHIFDQWSATGEKYDGWESCAAKWRRYGSSPTPAGVGTLRFLAKQGGYTESVVYECEIDWGFIEGYDNIAAEPIEHSDIDLQRPPGFVGEVVDWINAQCLKPRERLATAAGLVAIGNIAGLQYEDDIPGGTTSNLFIIGIAASGSGKNSIKNAISAIHREAGLSRVTYGASKSSQELYRALMSHQACLFNIDELGIKFQAIANASKSGASYYETWFGEMMSIYSNASGTVDLQEDHYKEIEKTLIQEIAFCKDKIANNEDPNGKYARSLERAEKRLGGDLALIRPFLSMIGYSTPERFDSMVTTERVTEGFIGRCLLVREPTDVVSRKVDFAPRPMSLGMRHTIRHLVTGGRDDNEVDRLCNYDKRIRIVTTPDAREELKKLTDYFEDMERHYEALNGMHAIPTRAEELILKISFILALGQGVRTLEHVRWAAAYVIRDIETKVNLAVGNSKDADALQNKILANLSIEEAVSTAQIRNRCRPIELPPLVKILRGMAGKGLIIEEEIADKRSSNKVISVWRLKTNVPQ